MKSNKKKIIWLVTLIPMLLSCGTTLEQAPTEILDSFRTYISNDLQDVLGESEDYDDEKVEYGEVIIEQPAEEIEKNAFSEFDSDSENYVDWLLHGVPSVDELPLGVDYLQINNNNPFFTEKDLSFTEPFYHHAPFDHLGRVGVANALLDVELMPADVRESINHIKPTGWNQENYEHIGSGGWLYNRSHLLGHQLTGYDGEDNLMTGTRQFNVDGMLPFENFVAYTVEVTEMQVRYRVSPVFNENDLLAYGVVMEGYSLDDDGKTLSFNIFIPNEQDGVIIDYETGKSYLKQ